MCSMSAHFFWVVYPITLKQAREPSHATALPSLSPDAPLRSREAQDNSTCPTQLFPGDAYRFRLGRPAALLPASGLSENYNIRRMCSYARSLHDLAMHEVHRAFYLPAAVVAAPNSELLG